MASPMHLKLFLITLLIGCAPTPPVSSVYLAPLTTPCPKPPIHKISMLEYCSIKGQQQMEYVSTLNDQPECPNSHQFLFHAFQEGITANDYSTEAYCLGVEDGNDYQLDQTQYQQLHQFCDPTNKSQHYKAASTHQLDQLLDENPCVSRDRTTAAFNIGYYCASHSPEYTPWKDRYLQGFTLACMIGREEQSTSNCVEWGEYLYLRISH